MEGARIVVTAGEYLGRFGRVLLTHDGKHPVAAKMLGIRADLVRVALETTSYAESLALLLPTAHLARVETDTELTARISSRYGHILRPEVRTLDALAKHLNMPRTRFPYEE